MKRNYSPFVALMLIVLLLGACGPTPTPEQVVVTKEVVVTQVVEVPAEVGEKKVVEFWMDEPEEPRVKIYEELAAKFMAAHPGIDVRIVAIEEAGQAQRIATALAANRLPDIVRMGVQDAATFAADGLLDFDAATAVIEKVGKDDFRSGPLAMVTDPATGKFNSVPYDGWLQAIWYRTDVFSDAGLEAPLSWDAINAACDKLPGTGNMLYALGLGTNPGENYGHQLFEQVAISNNAWPIDENGNVTMNTPEMIAALKFYTDLQRCAIPGPQHWLGARQAYELDQSGMLIYSTYIMDDLVDGSDNEDGTFTDLAVADLASNTGFAPNMQGPEGSASFGQLAVLGIMKDADPEAQLVAEYFMKEGYQDILALSPWGKIPVLKSAVGDWKTLSPYFEKYPPETLEQIANGYDVMQRWLFRPDYDATERAVVGDIEGRLLIPTAISNIALEGSMTPETAAAWLQEQVEALLAERQ
ncbi:MAG: carbohydrate ABC transporter substrate-binding protein [Chloroflexi bacterium]|nr:carbohydrate ABC transporter substrate-binding protein [Chloroflexota bacterium]